MPLTNLQWVRKGNTGCTFATLFSKNPDEIGWKFISYQDFPVILPNTKILSIEFPEDWSRHKIGKWALDNGFYTEKTGKEEWGLRIKCGKNVSWVQYFGKDSHVVTRQSPHPMLMYTCSLSSSYYIKVGWKGILHLAHAWSDKLSLKRYDLLWNRSFKQTKKLIGHSPTIKEAAKTTFIN